MIDGLDELGGSVDDCGQNNSRDTCCVVPEKDKGRGGQDVMALQNRNKVIETRLFIICIMDLVRKRRSWEDCLFWLWSLVYCCATQVKDWLPCSIS